MSQPLPEKSEMSESMKALGLDGMKGIETFKSGYGSVYGIVAKNKGLSLSITPKLEVGYNFVTLMVRVRAQKLEEWANLEDSIQVFGFPFEPRSASHASTDIFIPVALAPATPYEVGRVVYENRLIGKAVDEIEKRVTEAGSQLAVTNENIREYLGERLKDYLPTEAPKKIPEFKVLVGAEAYQKGTKEIAMSLYPEKFKEEASGKGDNEENDD